MPVTITDGLGGNSNKTSTSSITTSLGANVPVGSVIIVPAACLANATAPTCSDAKSNTYVRAKTLAFASSTCSICFFYAVITTTLLTTDGITVNFGVTSGAQAVYPYVINDPVATAAGAIVDVNVTGTGSSTSPSANSGTLIMADEALFGFVAVNGDGGTDVFTADQTHGWNTTDFSQTGTTAGSATSNIWLGTQGQVVTATTAVPWAPTISVSHAWGVVLFSIRGLVLPYNPHPQMQPIVAS